LHFTNIFSYPTVFFHIFTLLCIPSITLAAQSTTGLNLRDAIQIAYNKSPLIEVNMLEIEAAEENINQIFGTFWSPQFEAISYGGVISDARGDYTNSPDSQGTYDHLGPFIKIDLTAIQPIYSFGKYEVAVEAGRQNLKMKKAALKESFNKLSFEITKTFLGVAASSDGEKTGEELTDQYRELLKRIEELVQDPDSGIGDSHLLEAQTMLFDIDQQATKPSINKEQTLLYLSGLLNNKETTIISPTPAGTPEIDPSSDLLPSLLEFSRTNSPLIQGFNYGLKALDKKAELEEKKSYPDFFVAMGAGYGIAPGRDIQTNPFLSDDYNYKKLGAVLGLKWNFNYHVDSAKQKKAFLEYKKNTQKKNLALTRINGTIRQFYSEALRYQKLLNSVRKSLKAAKTWLRLENDNLDLGIGDVKRLVSAYRSYYKLKASQIETRYQYLLSLAQLANATGDMELFLLWIQNDKVQLN